MKLEELIRTIAPSASRGAADVEVAGVTCDSRQARPGYVFVAVPGSAGDGWNYADDALQRGAVCVVSEHAARPRRDGLHVQVPDARGALAALAAAVHGQPSRDLTVVGVTGTNGKTTTAYLLQSVFERVGKRCGLVGTVEYRIGGRTIPASRTTPDASSLQALLAQMRAAGCSAAVMEVSSHALDQRRTDCIAFDAAVFTNLTQDHLDYHKTMDEYFAAKRKLFLGLEGCGKAGSRAVINRDDPWGRRLWDMASLRDRRIGFGMESGSDVRAESVSLSAEGSSFLAITPWGRVPLKLRLMGRFNVYNALGALATAGALGTPIEAAAEAVQNVTAVPGRLETFVSQRGFKVFVDYAHTDDALRNVLATLRELKPRRLIAVFGCGGNRDRGKRPLMGRVASEMADFSVLTSDNPRRETPAAILEEIVAGFRDRDRCVLIEDRAHAIRYALDMAVAGDLVLVAGKGHERFQELANTTVPFDDRVVVRRLLDDADVHG
jgi:UDP-N-acetylmuramoyl-L-alanyl-D-glutamate--2,6-diaminopimelate ligase